MDMHTLFKSQNEDDETGQPKLFDDTETLPLFSGCAQKENAETFNPAADAQTRLPFTCAVCMDTGRVDGKYCTCTAGDKARYADKKANRVAQDAAGLSDGTIANLIDDNRLDVIEKVQAEFVEFVLSHERRTFTNWQEAWAAFAPTLHK